METTHLRKALVRFQMEAYSRAEKAVLEGAQTELAIIEHAGDIITPQLLEQIGCKKIHWSPEDNGGFWEYYLPVYGKGRGSYDIRLGVTFDEVPFMVRVVMRRSRLNLPGVRTVQQFVEMRAFLTEAA